ncbi:MAG: PAS domain-containing protein [Alphaproteobacteria bacterium]|nr:PAS domain-containing protein [Alphaproteobacteria bacterium]
MTTDDSSRTDGVIGDANLLRLHRYWDAKRGSRRWPSRADIDALDIPTLLGSIILVDVFHAPLRFRYRNTGTKLVQATGYNMHGRGPEEIPDPAYRAIVLEALTKAVEEGCPVARSGERVLNNVRMHYDALMLPLSSDGNSVDMLIGAQVYRPAGKPD